MIAARWQVDPYMVRYVWPLELLERVLDYMEAERAGQD